MGTQSAMFSGFLVGLRPVKNALQDLFTKGIKPKTSTNSPQPQMDELKVNNKQNPDVEGAPKKGPESIGKTDDFAKEPFLPDEYYQKIDSYLKKAVAARDAEVARIQSLSKTQQSKIATVVGGVDLRTGEVLVGIKNSIIYKGNAVCAEDILFRQLGWNNTNANIIMTPAIRPRTGAVIPVCTRSQTKFPVNQFIKGTVFDY